MKHGILMKWSPGKSSSETFCHNGGNTASRMNPKVVGFCDPKYEKVKKHLENMLVNGSDENFQLCVYVEGKCVIDLYGISDENSSYNANKTQVNFN